MAVSYLGQVGASLDHDGTFTIELSSAVAAGTALLISAAGYTSDNSQYDTPWSAVDDAGNTWAGVGHAGFSGGTLATLACQVENPLSIGDQITLTPPPSSGGAQFSATVDAFTGVDATTIVDTATQAPDWGYNNVSCGPIDGEGFTYITVMHNNENRVLTLNAPFTVASSAVYSDGLDGRQAWSGWAELDGTATITGSFSGSTGWGGALATSFALAEPGAAFTTTVWDGIAENPVTIAIWDGTQEIPIGVTERVPFDPPPAALPFWGAAVGGNSNPSPLEGPAGRAIGARRTYFNQGTTSSALSMAAGDVAAGRVPWLSFKLNDSWSQVANGSADTWAADLGNQLGALSGPVMVTFHHEPEGDEPDEAAFVAMHDRLYTFMQPHANIRCGPVLTGWTTLYSGNPEYALDTMWPGAFNSGDFLGLDAYNYYGTYSQQGTFNASTGVWSPQPGDTLGSLNPSNFVYLSDQYIQPFASWASSKGVDWAIGEFGFSYDAGQYDKSTNGEITWLRDVWDSAVATGNCLALCYFSSAYHARCDWRVDGDPDRLAAWLEILDESPAPGTGWGQ